MAKRISIGRAAATSGGQLEVAGGWRNTEVMLDPSFGHPLIALCPSRAVVLNCCQLVRLHTHPRPAHTWICGTAGLGVALGMGLCWPQWASSWGTDRAPSACWLLPFSGLGGGLWHRSAFRRGSGLPGEGRRQFCSCVLWQEGHIESQNRPG